MADDPRGPADDDEVSPLGAAPTLPGGKEPRRAAGRRRGLPNLRLGGTPLLILAAILLFAAVPLVGSSLKKTPRDKVGISYGGGPFEGSHFQRIVQPGSSLFFNGWFDPLFLYPADQRNYIISKIVGVGSTTKSDSVTAPSKDRVQVTYQVATYFKLNTDLLRSFHEQLGIKYRAYTNNGWNSLIQDTFRQQIENALQQETRRYNVADIYGSASLLTTIQRDVQQTLSAKLLDALGQPFFCGPTFKPGGKCSEITFIIKAADIPQNVVQAFQDNRTSQIQIQTQLNVVQQRTAEATAIKRLNSGLAAAGINYVLLRAIESGKVNFWVIPSSSGLTLQTPTSGSGTAAPAAPTPTTTPPTTAAPTTTTTRRGP